MVWSYKRSRGEIQTKPTLPDRFTAQTLDEAYMSHEKSGPRNYVHEKLHEQIVAKLQSELEQERERRESAEKHLKDVSGHAYATVQFPHKDMINLIVAIDLSQEHFAKYAKGEGE